MTQATIPVPSKGKTELKVKAATWAAFAVSLVGLSLIETFSADIINALPNSLNFLTPVVGSAIAAGLTWLAGYQARNTPENLSPSTVQAVKDYVAKQVVRRSGMGGNV